MSQPAFPVKKHKEKRAFKRRPASLFYETMFLGSVRLDVANARRAGEGNGHACEGEDVERRAAAVGEAGVTGVGSSDLDA